MNIKKILVIKSILYRISATLIVFIISLIVTGKINYALKISIFEVISKTLFYYIYDMLWVKIIKILKNKNKLE